MRKSRSIRTLLTGASVAALAGAMALSADAAPLVLGPGSGGTFVVPPAQAYDFVLITNYDLSGSFENNG
ncbi:MAG TPA: hypothetical protein VGF33_07120, partial [Caulobacteraceae bacterium]